MQPANIPDTKLQMAQSEPRPVAQSSPEQQVSSQEAVVAPAAESGAPAPTGMPAAPAVQQPAQTPLQQQTATPAVVSTQPTVKHGDLDTAGGDNIEKEWVDRADAIIKQHATDPYLEEEEHEDLSAAYLKRRFNLEIKRSGPKP